MLLIDGHSDLVTDVYRRRRDGERDVLRRVHLPALREGGVGGAVCPVGGDTLGLDPLRSPWASTLALLEALRADVAEADGAAAIVASAAELRERADAGVFAILPSLEGGSPLEGRRERVAELHELGVRSIGLVWNHANELASGVGADGGGLTEAGRAALAEMNRLGILVDVSHANERTFWDVVEATRAPIVASHSNARALRDNPRNLDDAQLDAIRALDGAVGVVLWPDFVGPQPLTIDDVVDHAEYLARRVGVQRVTIGADFFDYATDEERAQLAASSALYGDGHAAMPAGLEDTRKLGRLLDALARRGFAEREVAGIAAENLLRVLERAAAT